MCSQWHCLCETVLFAWSCHGQFGVSGQGQKCQWPSRQRCTPIRCVTFKGWHVSEEEALPTWSCLSGHGLSRDHRSADPTRCWCTHVVDVLWPLPHVRIVSLRRLCTVSRCRTQVFLLYTYFVIKRSSPRCPALFARGQRAQRFSVCCISRFKLLCTQDLQPEQTNLLFRARHVTGAYRQLQALRCPSALSR